MIRRQVQLKPLLQSPVGNRNFNPYNCDEVITHLGANCPPRKCRPLNALTPFFSAVKLMRTSGFSPTPLAFPSSTSHPLGMSTLTIGFLDAVKRGRTASNGARTGGLNNNPKMASRMTSVENRACSRSAVVSEGGSVAMAMLSHCF